jgi:hypothetical protein
MPLTAEEFAAAKKAYTEIRTYEKSRNFVRSLAWLSGFNLLFLGAVLCGLIRTGDHGEQMSGLRALSYVCIHQANLLWIWAILAAADFYKSWRYHPTYASNVATTKVLGKKYAGEYPFGLREEVLYSRPLLAPFLERLTRRPLLWRVDRFLSGKSATKN